MYDAGRRTAQPAFIWRPADARPRQARWKKPAGRGGYIFESVSTRSYVVYARMAITRRRGCGALSSSFCTPIIGTIRWEAQDDDTRAESYSVVGGQIDFKDEKTGEIAFTIELKDFTIGK